ncbi:coiled-coil domain-containing protein [Plantactinospora endophytica]|uniref:Uncharacterized protein n=1 Tax=Plantactinospora endophytica TaxID=673535 RepID=A0ABQ4E967_9ACTN|nr:hypothetical protein [Plantactinospora endophytica]GIG91189.1 hypothetical protein Pen02_61250 [Plantactinospora endophytica]
MTVPPQSPMSRAEADRVLDVLGAAHDRASAAMYALDGRPELALLRGTRQTGETAQVAAGLLARADALWSQFAAFGEVLGQAREVRARRSRPGDVELRELGDLLRAPVVGLDAAGTVLDDAAGAPFERVGLTELARRIEAEAAELAGSLSELEAARDRLAGWFGRLTDALRRLRVDAVELDQLDRLDRAVEEAYQDALADPFGAAGTGSVGNGLRDGLRRFEAELADLAGRLAELTQVRDGYPDRAARLAAELDELAGTAAETARVHALALAKIANSALPELPRDPGPALRAQLAQLGQVHREHRWAQVGAELVALERGVADARRRAAEFHEAADGLLRRRAELRGRLDAYRAKAGRLGLIEHTELSARYRQARDLLYTSPCDLSAATRAVVAYQRHLNHLAERPTPGAKGAVP